MKHISRNSSKFPGLSLELQISDRGIYLTFSMGGAWECFAMVEGRAVRCDCSDRFIMLPNVWAYCENVARQYAQKFAKRAAI